MHLEEIHMEKSKSNDNRQRERYQKLITFMKGASYDYAFSMFEMISVMDTSLDDFTFTEIETARNLAKLDLDAELNNCK